MAKKIHPHHKMDKLMKNIVFVLAAIFSVSLNAGSFGKQDTGSDPITVDADSGLKCDQNKKKCTAFNAIVKQSDKNLRAKTVSVFFNNADDIDRVTAKTAVKLSSAGRFRASGDHLNFDLTKGNAVLTGHAMAEDLERKQRIKANKIVLQLKKDKFGKTQIDWAEAFKNVDVKTPKTVASSQYGKHNGAKEEGCLKGNVRLTQKSGQLNGKEAIMNLRTGKNKIISGKKRPVRILLTPSKS